jgi:hypothetical protein
MISEAIQKINPNACCVVKNNDIDNIEWINTQPIDKELILSEVAKLQAEYESKQYQRNRQKEYPDFKEYLDGIVKGDDAQIQKYINDCLAVKAKYPKE